MKSAQILREKINSGRLTIGMIATFHFWMELVEISRNAGMDYLVIDQEHVAFSEQLVCDACALGRMIDFPILIRPPETEYSMIRRAADKGACGFLLPSVHTTAMLDEARDAIYMPPRGRRRPGGPGNRWVPNYQYETWKEVVEDDFIVLPQIESAEALENVDAIARHEITTAMAIGPYDLSASLGVCWQRTHPKLVAAQNRIRAAAKSANKNMWMIGDANSLIQQGFTFLCIGEPEAFFEMTLKNTVTTLRSGARAQGLTDKID